MSEIRNFDLNFKQLLSEALFSAKVSKDKAGQTIAMITCKLCKSSFIGFSDHRGAKEFTATLDAFASLMVHLRKYHYETLGE